MTDRDQDTRYQARSVEDVGYWHMADLQRPAELGPFMATLPTFGAECLLIAAFQT
jgi:hypothetical protein